MLLYLQVFKKRRKDTLRDIFLTPVQKSFLGYTNNKNIILKKNCLIITKKKEMIHLFVSMSRKLKSSSKIKLKSNNIHYIHLQKSFKKYSSHLRHAK